MKFIVNIPDWATWITLWKPAADGTKEASITELVARLTPYTEHNFKSIENNSVHLCQSCERKCSFIPCPEAGDDWLLGNDGNICCCCHYKPKFVNRCEVENEVWNFVKKLENDITVKELREMYVDECSIYPDYTYREAKSIYENWEERKKEIHIGDEVSFEDGTKAIVIGKDKDGWYIILDKEGNIKFNIDADIFQIEKTGRHFDEIEELLKKM